jgi:diguanylate cyclase (GGDEF)-like protein
MDTGRVETPESNDHELFRESVAEIDRIVRSSCRSTAFQISAVLAALSAPLVFSGLAARVHASVATIIYGVLLVTLALQIGDMFRHGRTGLLRERLTQQMKVAAMQRARASRLYDLSILDPLTGLHNRRFGEQRLDEEVARSDRSGDPLALLLFDLDYFKETNDQFGHAAGDAALKEFSRKLKRAIRACDVPVRLGGDEFLVILPECPRDQIERILERIGTPEFRFEDRTISVRYSLGRAHHQVHDTPQTLMQRADQMLYADKAARKKKDGTGEEAGTEQEQAQGQAFVFERPSAIVFEHIPEE